MQSHDRLCIYFKFLLQYFSLCSGKNLSCLMTAAPFTCAAANAAVFLPGCEDGCVRQLDVRERPRSLASTAARDAYCAESVVGEHLQEERSHSFESACPFSTSCMTRRHLYGCRLSCLSVTHPYCKECFTPRRPFCTVTCPGGSEKRMQRSAAINSNIQTICACFVKTRSPNRARRCKQDVMYTKLVSSSCCVPRCV